MAEIVNSLFGIDPMQVEQNRRVQDFAEAYKLAQLSPLDRATAGVYMGAKQLGRAGQQLFGGDEELNKATKVRELASQFDMTTADGLRQFAQAVAPFAPEVAQMAVKRSDDIITTGLKQAELQTQAIRNITTANAEKIRQVGLSTDGRQVYQAGDEQYILGEGGKRIPYYGKLESKTPKQEINVTSKGESEFVKKLATLDAKRVDEAATARDNAIAGLNNLNQLSNLNEQQLIGGAFATTRVGAVNFLNTLGLVAENDVKRLSASEQYAKTASDLVLQTLGGRLGAGFSNEDRKFIERIVPQLENSADARRQLISFMQTKFTNIVNEADRLETYARENNSLKGYKYTTPIPKAASSTSQFTRAELEAELQRKLKANQ